MDRKSLKRVRDIVTSSQSQKIQGSSVSAAELRLRASTELRAVADAYETAALAVDQIRALLANAQFSDKPSSEVRALVSALREATAVLTAARQEARDTVAQVADSNKDSPAGPPPVPESDRES